MTHAKIVLIEPEVTLEVRHHRSGISVFLKQDRNVIGHEQVTTDEFADFVSQFGNRFSVGEANVEIGSRSTVTQFRKYLQTFLN